MTSALIGRDHPAGMLRTEVGRALDSHGGLVLVTGEAGIGKTALVTEAMEDARRRGALVLSGSCWESDSAPGYWPWVQVIRALRRSVTTEEWAAAEEVAGTVLSTLLGESPDAGAAESFQLYDAVTTMLVAASQHRPVLVGLDDLHWADTASIRLLEFAAQHTWFERLLLLGTYRDVEVETAEHPLRPLLLPLAARATTVTLTGLDRAAVGALMSRTVGAEPAEELVTEVHLRTGGNPFFVEQTARLWRGGGSVSSIAPGVRDAVRRRLSPLPGPIGRLLAAAAVLGREFHRQVLAATMAAPVAQVDRMLDQAVTVRLVHALGAGRFAFAHDLVRETLYEELDETEARGWHAAVVRALDGAPALAGRVFPADLARHAYLAGPELEPEVARKHLRAAAKDAGGRLAFEEAIGHYRRALELVGQDEPRTRVLISLDLGRELHHDGDVESAWRTFDEAVALTRELADPELLARVALTLYRVGKTAERHQVKAELLREAYYALTGVEQPATDRLALDGLALELSVQSTILARRGGDDETLRFNLWTRHDVIWGPGTAAERETLTEELAALARRISDSDLEQFATSLRWVALLEQGDPRFLNPYHAFIAMAAHSSSSWIRVGSFVDQSLISALTGRFGDAEELLDRAVELTPSQDRNHFSYMAHHLRWALLLQQGRYEELDELARAAVTDEHPFPKLTAALTAVRRGDLETALRHHAEAVAEDEPYPKDVLPLWLRFQAEVAAASRDEGLCELARTELSPFAGQWLVSLYGCDIAGPAALWLAVLDAAQERWDEAVEGFTAAQQTADLLQARPWSIEARAGLAEALLARGSAGDTAAGMALLDEVARAGAETGMRHIAERVRRTKGAASTVDSPDGAGSAVPGGEFRFTGEVWSLAMDGREVHLPDAKGLRDLHYLLGVPGKDVPAVQLLNPEGGELVLAAKGMGGDAVLDDEAKARYRARLTRLDDEIDRATELGDDRRAAAFDRERDALLGELRAAAGLAGRDRRLGDEAERARKTVTARIRDTLRKLDQRHPELAAHLRAGVSTGATCRYQPEQEIHWIR
ncbi:ATP-binding protein [Amycolatopsis nigrescens]|uniref:ATP-binding protein n=1 Tax=Amycolatopsis nigrescens TaxID=381445 RepID=UPI0009FEDA0B|nr:AAA family ATPase [Amycolatopsis nigrescens]